MFPMSAETDNSDKALLNFIRRERAVTISAMIAEMGVTATAVRHRLSRVMADGLVERHTERLSRGRPNHRYSLTEKGQQAAGTNFHDMAIVLWEEIQSVEDPLIQRGLLKRISDRLVARYRNEIAGDSLEERMSSLARLMENERFPTKSESGATCRCFRRCHAPTQIWQVAIGASARLRS
jgi:predicted ArsR family transcriptional regulator